MGKPRILVVEDDRKTAAAIKLYLEKAGMEVVLVHDGPRGLAEARSGRCDLLVLDLMLPGMDGLELCRNLRRTSSMPVIMLTARTLENDRVRGLDTGADDYLPKPFSPRELVARIRAVLRRAAGRTGGEGSGSAGAEPFRIRDLTIDPAHHQVSLGGRKVELTPSEFRLLTVMARRPGMVFTREQLIEQALTTDFDGYDRTVDTHIGNLRRKLDPDRSRPGLITTVFGVGYSFRKGTEDE